MSTYEKYKIFSQKYEEKVKKSRKKNNKGELMLDHTKEVKNADQIIDTDELELEYSHGDCIDFEVYYSPITKKCYKIDLVLDDARKWETIREVE